MAKTSIHWTDYTWNPTTGCTKCSLGCLNCYAAVMTKRLQAMEQPKYQHGFKVQCHEQELQRPFSWTKSRLVFVNSMSDLFHVEVPAAFIRQVFETMEQCPRHTFQVLTKRADRLQQLSARLPWTENIWMGVSVENADVIDRIDALRATGAAVKFLSIEPLIGPLLNLNLAGIDWVVVGGESGGGCRPMAADWVRDIRDQCITAGIPFFFKQWGGSNAVKKKRGRTLDGLVWDEMPKGYIRP